MEIETSFVGWQFFVVARWVTYFMLGDDSIRNGSVFIGKVLLIICY